MNQLTEADKYLLSQIRSGSEQAWCQLVDRYQGRLLAFARRRVHRQADPEDMVQETFMYFLKGLTQFRGQASIETYLFTILRRKIADCYRGKAANICLLEDVFQTAGEEEPTNFPAEPASAEPTASWYARRSEEYNLRSKVLSAALRELINGFKKSLNFRDLQIVEMIFYSQLRNKDVGKIANLGEKQIALLKHRYLKQIQQRVARHLRADTPAATGINDWGRQFPHRADLVLSDIWREQRLSCLKRSTVGAYLLGTLDQPWQDYVTFHLERLGCQFCRANLEDLQQQITNSEAKALRNRIRESTVGFLRKSL